MKKRVVISLNMIMFSLIAMEDSFNISKNDEQKAFLKVITNVCLKKDVSIKPLITELEKAVAVCGPLGDALCPLQMPNKKERYLPFEMFNYLHDSLLVEYVEIMLEHCGTKIRNQRNETLIAVCFDKLNQISSTWQTQLLSRNVNDLKLYKDMLALTSIYTRMTEHDRILSFKEELKK